MNPSFVSCLDDPRRDRVREHRLHGLDYVEVAEDDRTLRAYFLGKAPERIMREHLRIVGGDLIRDLQVVDVQVRRSPMPNRDDYMDIRVDRTGDLSTYVLEVVESERGQPTDQLRLDFDPRYSSSEFRFRPDCPSNIDCLQEDVCPPEELRQPPIDYLAKDYASFRQLMLDRLALIMPEWRERHVPDLGIALVEVLAYVGDHLSYYQDAVATEAYLQTARQRISVRRHARLVDYAMHEGCNARAWVTVQADRDFWIKPREVSFITGVAGLPENEVVPWDDLRAFPGARFEVFEPMNRRRRAILLRAAHSRIRLYTWGESECCLAKGATSATFIDEGLTDPPPEDERAPKRKDGGGRGTPNLQAGDVIIFEEVVGPGTGNPADADPRHRQAVRLTRVESTVDPLENVPLLDVEWHPDDALAFPLCLSAIVGPECRLISDINVARGNVILVDHGQRQPRQSLGTVCTASEHRPCDGPDVPGDVILDPAPFHPTLDRSPITYAARPPRPSGSAGCALEQDPRSATSQVWIFSQALPEGQDCRDPEAEWEFGAKECVPQRHEVRWVARPDLIDSAGDAHDFVVEIDDQGVAHIRFGDGDVGARPVARTSFCVGFRLGNGVVGNVGPEAIRHMVSRNLLEGPQIGVRNPLAASGGIEPEPVSEVKLFAPTAYRRDLQRAVLPDDYARLAMAQTRHGVQRAAAKLRWTGSWYEAFVVVDPMGTEELDERLRTKIARTLRHYRRIGQGLEVSTTSYVALDVGLSVCVEPDVLREHVEAALLDLFSDRILPSGRRGFFHPDNLTFGTSVSSSNLVAAAMGVDGVRSATVTRLQRLGVGPSGELEEGILRIGPLEIARLNNDPNHPERGRLRLKVRGGR